MEKLSSNSGELTGEQLRLSNKEVGAKILAQINFRARHQEIVDSSFERAKRDGEKLVGKNDERRTDAYLSRLEKLVDKYGNSIEKIAWAESIKDDLLIKYENIPETYWKSKEQELRDNGRGSVELTEGYKHEIFNEERKLQRESLEKWANYLGDERSPYPLWFKVYAWDGMTKMGVYNKSKGKYENRNETTVAPYPDPDAEILGKVFEIVNQYYGNGEKEFYSEAGERNIDLEKIVQSGNFARIFNAVQKDIAPIVEPPENPEDIHGDWVEYGVGEEDDIARAARGTGWCVASSSVGRHYLEYGTYGQDDDSDNDSDNEWSRRPSSVKSKFILFHLKDPSTEKLSRNAVASIRLDTNGMVDEISGLKKGQALNDSLISIVEEKVKTLPGGEDFLPKFADKQLLIKLDRKMENDEDLTKDELEFLYEVNRPIETLDTYNNCDPRIGELRTKYDVTYALEKGVDANKLASVLNSDDALRNFDMLMQRGADINILMLRLDVADAVNNLDMLTQRGADINKIGSRLGLYSLSTYLDKLLQHGADINRLVSEMQTGVISAKIDVLLENGADINLLVPRFNEYDTLRAFDTLVERGVSIDIPHLVSGIDSNSIEYNFDKLIQYGADANQLVSKLDSRFIEDNFDKLIQCGADTNQLVSKLGPYFVEDNFDKLIQQGIDVNLLVSRFDEYDTLWNLDMLTQRGVKIDMSQLVSKLDQVAIESNIDKLLQHGADINQLVLALSPKYINANIEKLTQDGADVNQLAAKLDSINVITNLEMLVKDGVDIKQLVSRLEPIDAVINLDRLMQYGADINQLANIIKAEYKDMHDELLRKYGWQG